MSKDSVVIVDGARTPMGGLLGSLSAVPAPELATTAIAATPLPTLLNSGRRFPSLSIYFIVRNIRSEAERRGGKMG